MKIHRDNYWSGEDSVSGPGSNSVQTSVIRKEIPALIKEIGAVSILDIPCGDFNWMRTVDLRIGYVGADIVPELITRNQQKYGNEVRKFITLDVLIDHVPRADLILCRDCLVHFSFKDIASAVRNFKNSGSTYLLTTTFTRCTKNHDIITGDWRPINLQLPPFNFPEPVKVINEGCTEEGGKFSDKSLALWKLDDLRLS